MHLPALPEGFVVRHEEQPVLSVEELRNPHWSAKGKAILVPLEWILRRALLKGVVLRVELVVAKELEQRSVILVRARLCRDVDLRRLTAELGRIDTGLDLELLQRVDRRLNYVSVEVRIGIVDTIEGEVIEVAALPCDRDVLVRTRLRLAASLPGPRCRNHS